MTNEELVTAIQGGKDELIETLWEQCYKYIRYHAGRWERAWGRSNVYDIDDLTQAGYFAIRKAVKGWDASRGLSFIGYLNWCMKTEFANVVGCRGSKPGRSPVDNAISLDEPIAGDPDGMTIGETLGEDCEGLHDIEEQDFKAYLGKCVREAVAALPDQKRRAIEAYYFQGIRQKDIAVKMSVSASRAGQLVKEGLKSIRTGEQGAELRELLFGNRNYYKGTGYASWRESGTSQPEREVIYRDEMSRSYNLKTREGRVSYCVNLETPENSV